MDSIEERMVLIDGTEVNGSTAWRENSLKAVNMEGGQKMRLQI